MVGKEISLLSNFIRAQCTDMLALHHQRVRTSLRKKKSIYTISWSLWSFFPSSLLSEIPEIRARAYQYPGEVIPLSPSEGLLMMNFAERCITQENMDSWKDIIHFFAQQTRPSSRGLFIFINSWSDTPMNQNASIVQRLEPWGKLILIDYVK